MNEETTAILHCSICNLDFKNKAYYKKHLSTRRHAERSNTTSENKTLSCVCGRSYSYHQSLYVHRKTCEQHQKSKKGTDIKSSQQPSANIELIEKLKSYEKELAEVKAQIAIILDKQATCAQTNNHNNNNTIDNQTNNNIETQVNININAFGNENTEYLDDKAILECIGRVYKSIPSLVEKIHFDPKHPENHNIKITNKKLPYASVMGNNKKWKTVDRKDAIDTMVNNSYYILDDKFKENKNKISESKQEHFKGFQSRFDREDKELMKEIKSEVDMMVLNGV